MPDIHRRRDQKRTVVLLGQLMRGSIWQTGTQLPSCRRQSQVWTVAEQSLRSRGEAFASGTSITAASTRKRRTGEMLMAVSPLRLQGSPMGLLCGHRAPRSELAHLLAILSRDAALPAKGLNGSHAALEAVWVSPVVGAVRARHGEASCGNRAGEKGRGDNEGFHQGLHDFLRLLCVDYRPFGR